MRLLDILRICKISSSSNRPAPKGADIFICRHLNYLFDIRLHRKLADFGNSTSCKWKYRLPWEPVCSYCLKLYRSLWIILFIHMTMILLHSVTTFSLTHNTLAHFALPSTERHCALQCCTRPACTGSFSRTTARTGSCSPRRRSGRTCRGCGATRACPAVECIYLSFPIVCM